MARERGKRWAGQGTAAAALGEVDEGGTSICDRPDMICMRRSHSGPDTVPMIRPVRNMVSAQSPVSDLHMPRNLKIPQAPSADSLRAQLG